MSQNAFAGRSTQPDKKSLASILGTSKPLWDRLLIDLKRELKLDHAEWHTASVKLGWSLRLQHKKRNILYLGPRENGFTAAFVLGKEAVAAAQTSSLPLEIMKNIAEARRYAEGTGVRIEVKTPEDVSAVKILAKIKLEH